MISIPRNKHKRQSAGRVAVFNRQKITRHRLDDRRWRNGYAPGHSAA